MYEELKDPYVPHCFIFIFNSFLEIYNCSGESLTWTSISEWCKMRKVDLTQNEVSLILKCNAWANGKIKEMKDEEE